MRVNQAVPAAEMQAAIGAENRERVRAFFRDHIGATRGECSRALGLSMNTVASHVRTIRREWEDLS